MPEIKLDHWWYGRQWTIGFCLAILVANLGLFHWSTERSQQLIKSLQYDRSAILTGEVWRLVTGNMVHWSSEHFALDVGVFLVVGCLYEPIIRRAYPWLMLATASTVGVVLFLFQPELATYRGLSGVDSGQFAVALGIESLLAWQQRRRWLWVGPAAAVFVLKIFYECGTGQLFFGTESLGDIGWPVPLSHAAGVGAVLGFVTLCLLVRNCDFRTETINGSVCDSQWCDFRVH